MATNALSKSNRSTPFVFDDFFKPWNEWFENGGILNRTATIPAVNITENKDQYNVSLAAPGLKKEDFNIDVKGNMLSISAEKEEESENKEKDGKTSRKEYNYSSFSRAFTLPEDVADESIAATYTDGVLNLVLPKKEEAKKDGGAKKIAVK